MRVCQTARAAAAHARARASARTRNVTSAARRAQSHYVLAGRRHTVNCRECAANGVARGEFARDAMPKQTPAAVALHSTICAHGHTGLCGTVPMQRRAHEGTPTSGVSHTRSVVRRREACPTLRTRPPVLGARRPGARDSSVRGRLAQLADRPPPPTGGPRDAAANTAAAGARREPKKLELCRLSTAEVSAFHSGLFSHHCR